MADQNSSSIEYRKPEKVGRERGGDEGRTMLEMLKKEGSRRGGSGKKVHDCGW